VFQWLPFLHQAGGSVSNLAMPEAAAALKLWADMVKNGTASKDVINQRQYEVTNTFMAGNNAMVLCGPWELPRLQTDAKFDWRLTLLPVKEDKNIKASALGGYDWVVPKGAKAVDGAFKFVEFMSNPKILNEGWATGRLAPRSDVTVQDPKWPQAYAIYREQLQSAKARGPHPQWPDISRHIQTAMQEAVTGAKPADVALAEAAKRIEPILAKTPLP
jgi:multiple sugar transport system substrate-binding protein